MDYSFVTESQWMPMFYLEQAAFAPKGDTLHDR